jgi:hypothetical protein
LPSVSQVLPEMCDQEDKPESLIGMSGSHVKDGGALWIK